jgi:hypothetical protein
MTLRFVAELFRGIFEFSIAYVLLQRSSFLPSGSKKMGNYHI